tara:strand:- start:7367 stop:8818 length:1452 start_codon:yes stop_codon:yes gene_type:complete
MKQSLSKYLFIIFIVALTIPTYFYFFQIEEQTPLSGDFHLEKKPKYTKNEFINGSFQQRMESHLKDSIGFHHFFIRFNNQWKYSVFDKINLLGVVRNGRTMLPLDYVNTYLGKDYIGVTELNLYAKKLKELQDTLANHQIKFLFLIAPGKAAIYPEKIPQYLLAQKKDSTNYDVFTQLLEQHDVNTIDYLKYFQSKKNTLESKIFSDNGLHWSGNAVSYAADSLMNYLKSNFNLNVPSIIRKAGTYTVEDYRYTDYDLVESMNLMQNIARDTLYYPELEFTVTPSEKKPVLLSCGDSFFQSFEGFYPVLDSCFSDRSRFHFYNEIIEWPDRFYGLHMPADYLDLEIELPKTDLVILESTDENIKLKSFVMIERLLNHYKEKTSIRKSLLAHLENQKENQKLAKKYFALANYTYEEMLRSIAKSKLTNEDLDVFNDAVLETIEKIKSNKSWFEAVKQQAIDRNITIEEALRINAEFTLEQLDQQ